MKFIKSVVSLRYDFCVLDISCSNESTKGEILSVGTSQPEMIGLYVIMLLLLLLGTLIIGLWIFVRV